MQSSAWLRTGERPKKEWLKLVRLLVKNRSRRHWPTAGLERLQSVFRNEGCIGIGCEKKERQKRRARMMYRSFSTEAHSKASQAEGPRRLLQNTRPLIPILVTTALNLMADWACKIKALNPKKLSRPETGKRSFQGAVKNNSRVLARANRTGYVVHSQRYRPVTGAVRQNLYEAPHCRKAWFLAPILRQLSKHRICDRFRRLRRQLCDFETFTSFGRPIVTC